MKTEDYIQHTENWVREVVMGFNFCPFAAREVKRASIAYQVEISPQPKAVLQTLALALAKMNGEAAVETLLLILPKGFSSLAAYLKLLKQANSLLHKQGYGGVYQLASFHPHYAFAELPFNHPGNYTNRSPYPVIQVLRESSVSWAVESYPDTLKIPERNIAFAMEKGLAYMKAMLEKVKDV